jgi:hypothetical protein
MTRIDHNSKHESEGVPDLEDVKDLLKAALPRIADDEEPSRDLWPDMLQRMDRETAGVPWFDWALVGGLVALTAALPSAIPVFLYYL